MTGSFLHKIFSTPSCPPEKLAFFQDVCQNFDLYSQKIRALNHSQEVVEIFNSFFSRFPFREEEEVVLKSLIAIGQGEKIFKEGSEEGISFLLSQLLPVEQFYREMGGIVGYYLYMLYLLDAPLEESSSDTYLFPEGKDIGTEDEEVRGAMWEGIASLPHFGEVYPVGGAADRLSLFDSKTGEPLPAACLQFLGKPLLAGMIRDLQGKEYLHFKLFGTQCTTPIALMTSFEKNNHAHMVAICEQHNWFGRPSSAFRFFSQPSVPTIDREGNWCMEGPMRLLLKPGGHGVIWKLARDQGVFKWLQEHGRSKVLVRQINNPIAGLDYGLAAFAGIGWQRKSLFGFASCPCIPHVQEGTNVLIEKSHAEGFRYVLTNIEYCDLQRKERLDSATFSTNTNLLFVDLKAIEEGVARHPFPGKIVNFKKAIYRSQTGEVREEEVARLESMMQNIADVWTYDVSSPLEKGRRGCLPIYITHHIRHKTISSVKRVYVEGGELQETPEGCYRDYRVNMQELLTRYCKIDLKEESFSCVIHPALGPFFSVIGQKIQGGLIFKDSDLELEISDLYMENLELAGALFIEAENIMGHTDSSGKLTYSEWTGKCVLQHVKVCNRGVDLHASNIFWKRELHYHERCVIKLKGYGEFFAENVTLPGNFFICVENGMRVTAFEKCGKLELRYEKIEKPTWGFCYEKRECDPRSHSLQVYPVFC